MFYFLELNPRLQVEHSTTEIVTGVNLPTAQLLVAMGIPIQRNKIIRQLYGVEPHGASEIDFDMVQPESNQLQRKPRHKGHVVAVRITAENPDAGFKSSSGALSSTKLTILTWAMRRCLPLTLLRASIHACLGILFSVGYMSSSTHSSATFSRTVKIGGAEQYLLKSDEMFTKICTKGNRNRVELLESCIFFTA